MPLFAYSIQYTHTVVPGLMMDFPNIDSAAPSQTRVFTGDFTWESYPVEVNCRHIWKPKTSNDTSPDT